ncbi:ABC transporter ATP-binding protein/permease [Desulfogranum japonicum]|uniref:ABC transporter ATP-binding protein/permease n=1 Tax=Desulfogranum japonicum TaxID=231447 RepID=UPI0004140133|nr:ABC transporter ATP-binding protein/permease [Desulfogranum japonicum]
MNALNSQSERPVTEKRILFWAFHNTLHLQVLLLAVIAVMVATRVVPLEMQKRIINDAIVLKKLDQLFVYCAIYIFAVSLTSLSKLGVNFLQAKIGEQAILSMRQALYNHIISLPMPFFRNTQPGVVVASLMTELASAGTFAGMALAVPVANILTLLVFAGYLLSLNPRLALSTLSIYPLVVLLVPYLQKKANRFNKKRVDQSRLVTSHITESITGIQEVNVHGAYSIEKEKFSQLTERLRSIRVKWSLLRFGIKTANNYFVGLGPFIVFIFGGYLVMHGQLELGSMVAFLSAQEKLYDPWKELIDFYQVYQDASVRYERTMKTFALPSLPSTGAQKDVTIPGYGTLELTNVGYTVAEGKTLMQQINFSLQPGEHLALVGFSGSGKSTLIQCIAKIFEYTAGSIRIDGVEVKDISHHELIQHVGYISQNPFIFSGTVQDNLIYAQQSTVDEQTIKQQSYIAPALDQLILSLQQAGFFVDVIRFGLETPYEQSVPKVSSKIITMRKKFRDSLMPPLDSFIELYDPAAFLYYSNLLDNITFSRSLHPEQTIPALLSSAHFIDFLTAHELKASLLRLGTTIAKESVEYYLTPKRNETPVLNTPLSAESSLQFATLVSRLNATPGYKLSTEEERLLLIPALLYTPGKHSSFTIPPGLAEQILATRPHGRDFLQTANIDASSPLCDDAPVKGQSIFNNILFGRMKTDATSANEQINQAIIRVLIEEDCLEDIAEAGMQYQVGNMGDKLSGGQKQKLAIARVLLKDPKILLMDEATSALDNASQARIQRLMTRWKGERTVIAVVHRLDSIQTFDVVGVMKSGKLAEYGTYDELMNNKGMLHELITGQKVAN